MKYVHLLFLLTMFLCSCGTAVLYEEHKDIPEFGWRYADTLNYEFSVTDTLQIYDLYLTLWHNREYPFQNMYVNVNTTFPGGQRLTERLSLEMMDEGHSTWLGDCGSGHCRLELSLQRGAFFQQPGTYQITLEQFTRRDTLPGVEKIALKIEEADARREFDE